MSTQPLTPQQLPRVPDVRRSLGTIVLGAILILGGLAWILDVLDVVSLSAGVILPSALILVGIALLAASLTGSGGGLVALGIILTLVLTAAAAVDVPLSGGAGDRTVNPTTVSDLPNQYQLMVGNLNVNLTDLSLPAGVTTVKARVGIGQLTIDVPRNVAVEVHWNVSAGNVNALGTDQNGWSFEDRMQIPGYAQANSKLVIEARMGFGNIDVRRP